MLESMLQARSGRISARLKRSAEQRPNSLPSWSYSLEDRSPSWSSMLLELNSGVRRAQLESLKTVSSASVRVKRCVFARAFPDSRAS